MTYYAALCDDERTALSLLSEAIKKEFQRLGLAVTVDAFDGSQKLKDRLLHPEQQNAPLYDVLFLDIDMPGLDGISLGELLREDGLDLPIVYLSNRDDLVFDSLRVHPLRFVRKSRLRQELREAVAAIVKRKNAGEKPKLLLSCPEGQRYVRISDIMMVESFNKEQRVTLVDRKITVRHSTMSLR